MSVISRNSHGHMEAVDNDIVISKCADAIRTLEGIRKHNLDTNNSYMYNWQYQPNYMMATCRLHPAGDVKIMSDKIDSELTHLIKIHDKIVASLSTPNILYGSQFISAITCNLTTHGTEFRFNLEKIVDTEICTICTGIYTKAGMGSHTGSLRCLRDKQCLDVKSMGYEIIDDTALSNAVRKSGIPYEVRPSMLDMWVPGWVAGAIKEYSKNNGFANLELHEFLKQMVGK